MINNREDLKRYLAQDKARLNIPATRKHPRPFYDEVWKFEIALRKAEYAVNCNTFFLYRFWRKIQFHRLSVKCGFSIPLNVFGPGLSIAHYGTIVVNSQARVGENCRIQEGVNIGASKSDKAPQIGSNVFLGSGAKLIGEITIANGIAVGAGAVVTKSFEKEDITIAGIPAKKISDKGSKPFILGM
jgi:serine O-acetyltransferase